ncbi:hypothetical protein EJ05DRAFT_477269 [Pseudovirgaria hyperparasitica]|uniref:Ino eighty subunit 1 n=1 Tax=Pseudovirgaria hyperparasitica TaxID=470096 RepID=A0A6A6W362_9PEZI|nr:uncharacterized protein EJ05DRAFT_477269 [Pseudovirgaria hyperparasitica]KAF2757043.1 hypothetical protein EJ05DRAFT_477269 [Pseudovirgaria hyperparasitica]
MDIKDMVDTPADSPSPRRDSQAVTTAEPSGESRPHPRSVKTEAAGQLDEDMDDDVEKTGSAKGDDAPMYTATTTTTRRNANGSVSSVYSGNKIRHLKKEDGVPLWRKDIQYDFLRLVFEDDKRVFHKASDGSGGHTFADIYLDAMAKSSKCSKILKDKLLTERGAAINMAMVCLLVNVGRMNTTLNFFPEMRAQLRTYHAIPSLQAHQDPNAYKQLQDAPRLKSILKGATEDTEQPSTVEDIKSHRIPRTNPVNLIFVLAQYAPKISELHFVPPRDFFDLVMRETLSSRSRATAFLWLMWWYLESNFSKEDAENNPFGPGLPGSDGDSTNGLPIKCPAFVTMTPEEVEQENVDTQEEKDFGWRKKEERKQILASDMAPVVTGPKRANKKVYNQNPVFSVNDAETASPGREFQSPIPNSRGSRLKIHKLAPDYNSDTDRTRSVSPPASHSKSQQNMNINTLLNDDTPAATPPTVPARKGPGRGNWARNRNPNMEKNRGYDPHNRTFKSRNLPQDSDSTAMGGPHGFYLPLNGAEPATKRSRPITAHQAAVEKYRKERVAYILDTRLRKHYALARKHRSRDGAMARAWLRCKMMTEGYDTDDDMVAQSERERAELQSMDRNEPSGGRVRAPPPTFVGLLPMPLEPDDYGEEAHSRLSVMRKAGRRMERWEEGLDVPTHKQASRRLEAERRHEEEMEEYGDDDGVGRPRAGAYDRSSPVRDEMDEDGGDDEADEELDDEDREMLGEIDDVGSSDEDEEADVDEGETMVGVEVTG